MSAGGPPDANAYALDKIRTATQLYRIYGSLLRQDQGILGLLHLTEHRIHSSRKIMEETRVAEICRQCHEEEGGSCCGAGIELRYNPVLLLINLLLDVNLPADRLGEKDCFYLGAYGCILKAREVICVNYLCTGLQKKLKPHDLKRLQAICGDEMDTTYLLQERIKTFVGRNHGDSRSADGSVDHY